MEDVVYFGSGIQYDGTNSTDILALFPAVQGFNSSYYEPSIASESGGVLTIHYDDYGAGLESPVDFVVNENDWVLPLRDWQGYPQTITPNAVRLSTLVNP